MKLDETVVTASTSAEYSCGKSSAAKRGRHTKPVLTAMTDTKAVTLEELQKGDGNWFTVKPAVTIVALCWDRYSYHCCVECRLRALPIAEGKYGCAQHPAAKTKERGSSVGRMPDSQSREPGFESPLLPFRSLGIFFHFTTPQSIQLYK